MADLTRRLPLHRATIYALVRAGTFPAPVQISPGRSAFRERDVDQYLENCRPGITKAAQFAQTDANKPRRARSPR